MIDIKVKGDRELGIYLDGVKEDMKPNLRQAVRESLVLLNNAVKENLSNKVLHIRSGELRRSISFEMFSGDRIGGRVGTNKEYARQKELGGTIKAKNVKNLTIPFPGIKGRAKDYPHSFVFRSKSGNLIMAQIGDYKGGILKGSKFKPLFLLKPSVYQPPRPFMEPSLKQNVDNILEIFSRRLDKDLKQ